MSEPVNEEKILERVRKLLAKAEARGATEAEAEMYTAKAMELIAKYGIDEALLTAQDPERDQVGDRVITIYGPYIYEREILLHRLAEILGGNAIRINQRKLKGTGTLQAHLFGYGADLERIELLYTSLLVQAGTGLARADAKCPPWEGIRAFRATWLRGFKDAVIKRLREIEARSRQQADTDRTSGPSTALVLADRKTLVDRRLADAYPKMHTTRSSLSGTGRTAGYQAGMAADLGGTRLGRTSARVLGR
jgi:hypothetical protein